MKQLQMISDGTWFDKGTEVFSTKSSEPIRMSVEEFENDWKPYGFVLVMGLKDDKWDEETCSINEFDITEIEEKIE